MPDLARESLSLKVRDLALARRMALLGPLSFALPGPGCWWLTGDSGAGKSLLLESLAGFHAEAEGSVLVAGQEVGALAPEERGIALMPQRWRLFPHWTVARNLRFAAQLGGESADRVQALAECLGVTSLLHRTPRALSGGETQRLCLIQTVLAPARVLLLDEPLSAIDRSLQSSVFALLREEAATDRICIIAAHHRSAEYNLRGSLRLEKGRLVPEP